MADSEKQQQDENKQFIKETIVKKKKTPSQIVIYVLVILLGCAVAGLCIGASFGWAYAKFGRQNSSHSGSVVIPDDEEPTEPVESSSGDESATEQETSSQETSSQETSSQEETAPSAVVTVDSIKELDKVMQTMLNTSRHWMVTVNGYSDEDDWMTGTKALTGTAVGGVVYSDGRELRAIVAEGSLGDYTSVKITLPIGGTFEATLKGRDSYTGLAVFSVDTSSVGSTAAAYMQTMEFGNSFSLGVGDTVVVLGNPYGVLSGMDYGHITGVSYNTTTADGIYRYIYTSMSLPEDGGGFVIDLNGHVVGIISAGLCPDKDHLTFAGISEIKSIIEKISNGGQAAGLGVEGISITATVAFENGLPEGLYITKIMKDSAAFEAGLQTGDVLVSIDGEDVSSMKLLGNVLGSHKPGDKVTMKVMRQNVNEYKEIEITAVLTAR